MTYTGDVSVGGPSDVRDLAEATIRKASVSAQDNNSYLITCRRSGEQLLIDAADDPARLRALIAETSPEAESSPDKVRLHTVATTHRHWDHHRALADIVKETGARAVAGREDADDLPVPVDVRLTHGDRLQVGELSLDVVHLRGHTPGSVTLLLTSSDGSVHAFTGDSLFPGGPGRTTSPADFTSLMDDLEERIFGPLPDSTWIYPGHGKDSTIGVERPHLAEWRARGW
jgi:glyoxylase-like metal-dependent hydrolase (beta-lactamase superfamily II)